MAGGLDNRTVGRRVAGFSLDPVNLALAIRGRRRAKREEWNSPTYDANINTGGKYQAQTYNDPTLQANAQGQTGILSGPGAGESQGQRVADQTQEPSASEQYAQRTDAALTTPGQSEMFAARNQARLQGAGQSQQALQGAQQAFQGPGESAQYWNQVQGRFNQPTNAQTAFDSLQNMPNFDAYYNRARERLAGGMNDQFAARGMMGSSAALDQMSQGLVDLNSQQANREADFMLQQQQQRLGAAQTADAQNQGILGLGLQGAGQRFQERLGGQQLLGNLAGQADQNLLARVQGGAALAGQADQQQAARLGLQGQLFNAGDEMHMARLGLGLQGATTAQQLQQGRMQDMFNNTMAMSGAVSNTLGQWYPQMLQSDQALFDSAMAGEMGLGAEAVNQDRYRTQERMQMAQTGINAVGAAGQLVGGFMG